MTKKETTSKIDPVLEILLQFQSSGSEGMPLCAPKMLHEKIKAIKYTPSGVIPASDKLLKIGINPYLEKSTQKNFEEGEGKKKKQFVLEYYVLSLEGKARLAEHEMKQKEEEQKKVASLEGSKEIRSEKNQQRQEIIQPLQKLKPSSEEITSVHQVLQELQQNIHQKITFFQEKTIEQFEKLKQEIKSFEKELQHTVQEQIDQYFLKQQAVEIFSNVKNNRTLEENVSDYKELAERVENELPKLLSNQNLESIPQIYKKIKAHHLEISPGHFNDILWKMSRENKLLLKTWDRSLWDLEEPQHAILRKEIYFFARLLKKEEMSSTKQN
ncbi:MAG: hypothetical protein AABZ60_01430 [Planctomycetota bacterium]